MLLNASLSKSDLLSLSALSLSTIPGRSPGWLRYSHICLNMTSGARWPYFYPFSKLRALLTGRALNCPGRPARVLLPVLRNSTHLLQVDQRYHKVGLQLLKPPFDRRLLLVRQEQVPISQRAVIAHNWADPITPRFLVQPFHLNPVFQLEPQLLFPDIPRFLPRSAALLLPIALGNVLLDLDRDPLDDAAVAN
jgi:hypothetical protein